MAKYTDAKCRICRREGTKLFLKGDRCFSGKCAVDRRPFAPGQHGRARKKVSEYAVQLREKQKTRRTYGLLERQFHSYFIKADMKKGVTGTNLLVMLESRLDNVV
ncbi:MAG: 30S ribosomal protein S4, partial [Desulfovibrio sp.]|nr:30S ribosomal protein S4 [Desulfovibrio sp.]